MLKYLTVQWASVMIKQLYFFVSFVIESTHCLYTFRNWLLLFLYNNSYAFTLEFFCLLASGSLFSVTVTHKRNQRYGSYLLNIINMCSWSRKFIQTLNIFWRVSAFQWSVLLTTFVRLNHHFPLDCRVILCTEGLSNTCAISSQICSLFQMCSFTQLPLKYWGCFEG